MAYNGGGHNQENLRRYLSNIPQILPFVPNPPPRSSNTRNNHRYVPRHIQSLEPWPQFNVQHITAQYNNQMGRIIVNDPFPNTPPLQIRKEVSISHRLWEYLGPRVRRSLRVGFNPLPQGHTPVFWNLGDISPSMDEENSAPDLAFYAEEPTAMQGMLLPPLHNRLPGDVKPSTKWNSDMAHGTEGERLEYRQAISQLNYYMHIQQARYGFILTNRELVAFERLPTESYRTARFRRSNPIPWVPTEQHDPHTPTVLMAMWYLGMLAARQDWFIRTRDEPEPDPRYRRGGPPR